jgi:hypothetical protein
VGVARFEDGSLSNSGTQRSRFAEPKSERLDAGTWSRWSK